MMSIRPELLDELLAGYEKPEDLLGAEGLFKQLKKALVERALGAELSEHLGYEKGDPAGRGTGNSRNGYSEKTVLTEDGEVEISVPRDRNCTFEPVILPKGERRIEGFDDRIVSLYARGMSVREIQGHLQELYGVEVSPDLISRATDAVLEEVREWQNRPLDAVYPVVFFDALRVKIRDEGLACPTSSFAGVGSRRSADAGYVQLSCPYRSMAVTRDGALIRHKRPRVGAARCSSPLQAHTRTVARSINGLDRKRPALSIFGAPTALMGNLHEAK